MRVRYFLGLGGSLVALSTAACSPVDCDAVCDRTLACGVSFDAPDDPDGARIRSGERSEAESCVLGCQTSPLVDHEAARCIADVRPGDAEVCEDQVAACLGASTP